MFETHERALVAAALDEQVPGVSSLGGVEYVERLLGALEHEPPRIWAAPAGSGRRWLELGPWERHAWGERIAEWRAVYGRVIDGTASDADRHVVHAHACEAAYGDPAYGGNRDGAGWVRISFPQPLFPPERT